MQKYVEFVKPDKKKIESNWYQFCSREQIPFIKVTTRSKFSDIHWDYITYNHISVDQALPDQAEHIKSRAKEIFNNYAHAKSSYNITETIIEFYDLEITKARLAAEELYDLISSTLKKQILYKNNP